MRAVMKETQERVRMFEENQRRWQEQHHLSSPPPLQQATVSESLAYNIYACTVLILASFLDFLFQAHS